MGLHCYVGFSLAASSGSYSLVVVSGLLLVVASPFVTPRLWSRGSNVEVHGLSCSMGCGIFPNQGLNPCVLHWQVGS